ncbi:ATP-binding protein [Kitasatospora brasiliensis]|uniref:ATP-binding protein n=1 Tax=Kitasatospora brasiliensis TaxID=3058040 RepID=UPI00292DB2E8|nr:tetratricopeptide repeat protein [Kitasatospora sp. K002]
MNNVNLPCGVVRNSLAGAATVSGSVVQAGEIHGGLHLYGAPALPTPRQLPPSPRKLIGRKADLEALDSSLAPEAVPADVTVVVTGPAGVGKTALAARWLRGMAGRFPDGQLYADLRGYAPEGPVDPAEALGGFLRAFGISPVPGSLAEGAALWRSLAAERRIAVLLDNASTAAQVRPLLPGSEHTVVVVTSRRRLTGLGIDGAVFRPLSPLATADSAEILAERVGRSRVADESDAAAEVVSACGGLPLAICLAAARIAARPVQSLAATAEILGRGTDRLAALRADGETVRGLLDASYDVLEPDAARLYGLLGLLPFARFTLETAAVVADVDLAAADRLLDDLLDVHLLEELGSGRFRFHDLVRLHAQGHGAELADTPLGRAAVDRVVDWYLASATAAEAVVSPSHRTLPRDYRSQPVYPAREFTDDTQALGWLDEERDRLAELLRWAPARDRSAATWQLADAMWPLFLRLRPARLWVEAHRIGLRAARADGDRHGELRMLTSGGNGLRNAGEAAEAADWFLEALDLARELAHPLAQADALYGLSQTHRMVGRLDEAADRLGEVVRIREAQGYLRGSALARLAFGEVLLLADRAAEAVEPIERAHRELSSIEDDYEAARAIAFLGQAHAALGAYDEADRCLREALTGFRARLSGHWEARTLEFAGQLEERRGRPDAARARFEESRDRYQALGATAEAARLADRLAAYATGPDTPVTSDRPADDPGP